jgi:hypothetical protein
MRECRSLWSGVVLAAVLAACSDNSAGPGTLTNPVATSAALSSLDSAFVAQAVVSYGSLGRFITPSAALARAGSIASATRPRWLPAGTPPEVAVAHHLAGLRGLAAVPSSPQGPIIADSLYGSIFTWDSTSMMYVRSQTTGGPTNGIEFVLYAVNPVTGDIVYPLIPVGVAEFLDESSGNTAKLHIRVKDDLTTYLDYTATLTPGVLSLTATVSGFVTNGASGGANKTLTFDVNAQVTLITVTAQATFTLNNPVVTIFLNATATSLQGTETVSVTFSFTRPGETVQLKGSVTTTNAVLDTVTAEIRVNGQLYASVEGNASGVNFYDKDGNVITDAGAQHDVIEALDHLRAAVEETIEFIDALFNPIGNLLTG